MVVLNSCSYANRIRFAADWKRFAGGKPRCTASYNRLSVDTAFIFWNSLKLAGLLFSTNPTITCSIHAVSILLQRVTVHILKTPEAVDKSLYTGKIGNNLQLQHDTLRKRQNSPQPKTVFDNVRYWKNIQKEGLVLQLWCDIFSFSLNHSTCRAMHYRIIKRV